MRRHSWWSLALVSLLASPAFAQVSGTPWEISGLAGIFSPDARTRVETGPAYGGSLGYRWQPWFVTEGYVLFAPSNVDTVPGQKANFSSAGVNLRFNLVPGENRVVPYVFAGAGYGLSHDESQAQAKLERGTGSIGMGALFNLMGNPRHYLRLEVRDVLFRDRDAQEFSNNVGAYAGLHYVFGGKSKDVDLDGVRDWLDECPQTPLGAKVDAKGCPTDADGDKVWDGLDKCNGTPLGATVNKDGCPSDADGDGVFDGLDACASTPAGATVDANGCPKDSDADGILDGIDQCENTPVGCTVNTNGCPSDADQDGVCDGVDKCPDTPANVRVDRTGCPIEVSQKETELLDTGMIRLQDVNFDTGKSTIKPESEKVLDEVGDILARWPELRIEIGGHTDSRGSDALNQSLSDARAKAVLDYLLNKFPELRPEQFSSKGYGESQPIAPNNTQLGMAKNRRVEFKVLNTEVLKREKEKRSFVPKQ